MTELDSRALERIDSRACGAATGSKVPKPRAKEQVAAKQVARTPR